MSDLQVIEGGRWGDEHVHENMEEVTGRILYPLACLIGEMESLSEDPYGSGWINPLKALLADAQRRLEAMSQALDRDLGPIDARTSEDVWDFHSTVPGRYTVRGSKLEKDFVCPHCLSKGNPLVWDELNDLYHCQDCGKTYDGVEGLFGQFVEKIRKRTINPFLRRRLFLVRTMG